MVLADSDRISRVRPYSGSHFASQYFNYRTFTLFGLPFQSNSFILFLASYCGPTTPCCHGLGFFPFARRYLGNRFFFLFLQVLRCFSSLGLPPITLFIQVMVIGLLPIGFPHSDISRSLLTYSSLMRFAVRCVLLRLLVPRHPPCALINLT